MVIVELGSSITITEREEVLRDLVKLIQADKHAIEGLYVTFLTDVLVDLSSTYSTLFACLFSSEQN